MARCGRVGRPSELGVLLDQVGQRVAGLGRIDEVGGDGGVEGEAAQLDVEPSSDRISGLTLWPRTLRCAASAAPTASSPSRSRRDPGDFGQRRVGDDRDAGQERAARGHRSRRAATSRCATSPRSARRHRQRSRPCASQRRSPAVRSTGPRSTVPTERASASVIRPPSARNSRKSKSRFISSGRATHRDRSAPSGRRSRRRRRRRRPRSGASCRSTISSRFLRARSSFSIRFALAASVSARRRRRRCRRARRTC